MAIPSEKSSVIEKLLTEINGGKSRRAYIHADKCVRCGEDATYFLDEVSRREYAISGWCQHCQDEMFDDTATEGM
tara:strand:+ start:433 stop:657 length:225 start_codon:yes stop_codon:yes gene_type:complete